MADLSLPAEDAQRLKAIGLINGVLSLLSFFHLAIIYFMHTPLYLFLYVTSLIFIKMLFIIYGIMDGSMGSCAHPTILLKLLVHNCIYESWPKKKTATYEKIYSDHI